MDIPKYLQACGIAAILMPALVQAQTSDTIPAGLLSPVTVTSTRLDNKDLHTAFGLSVLSRNQMQSGQAQLSPAEFLAQVPGVFFMNADNFAQDLRISLRGVGSRAAFGIRGIRIMVDELPESTPDGQGQIDNLDLGILDRMELIRGPASGLYGNAAGGVLSFYTEEAPDSAVTEFKATLGSFGFQQYQLKTAGRINAFQYVVHGAHVRSTGYRAQSSMRNTLINGKFRYTFSEQTALTLLINNGSSPQADDAGALTEAQADTLPRMARDVNVRYQAGESVGQSRVGLLFDHRIGTKHQFKARVFATFRDFENKLAFTDGGIVALKRIFYGGGIGYFYRSRIGAMPYRMHAGVDLEDQRDQRRRFDNKDGVRDALAFDQLELFRSLGVFCLQTLSLTKALEITANLRVDALRLAARDHFFLDGDDSDRILLQNASPMAGARYTFSPQLNVYANVATSFETPALSELSANPAGGGGFNTALKPQRALSVEAGIKGLLQSKLRYEVALYQANGRNELVSYELAALPGRSFYRNSGASLRRGLEMSLFLAAGAGITMQFTYTLNLATYTTYAVGADVFDGNRWPGLPQHSAYTALRYAHRSGAFLAVQMRYTGDLYAEDANAVNVPAFTLIQLRGGYPFKIGKTRCELFGGINNLMNTFYYNNIRINAAAKRFYEPAAGRNFYVGLQIGLPGPNAASNQ